MPGTINKHSKPNCHWTCHMQLVDRDFEAILPTVKISFLTSNLTMWGSLEIYDYVGFFSLKKFVSNIHFVILFQ